MRKIIFKLFILFIFVNTLIFCSTKGKNRADVNMKDTAAAYLLGGSNPYYYQLYGDIDTGKTSSCGTATSGSSSSSSSTTSTTTTATSSNSSSGTTSTVFSVVSQLYLKTYETLQMKFTYDYTLAKGPVDKNQGFVVAGGLLGGTATGTTGSIVWTSSTNMAVDTAETAAQNIRYFTVDLDLQGTFQANTTTNVNLNSCNTSDGKNCTTQSTNGITCFTSDNVKCITSGTSGTPIFITGTINCAITNISK